MELITTQQKFDEVIASESPVIIKFFTTWCPDCTRMNMFMPEVVEEYTQFGWYTMNRDDFPEIGQQYSVMGIPSLLLFQNGEKKAHLHSANAKTADQVKEYLDEIK